MAAKRACTISELKGKLDADCFLYLVRKDKRKFSRATQLLKTNEEIKVVRKMELKVEEEMKGGGRGDEEGPIVFFPLLFGQYEGFYSNHDKHTGCMP